MSISWDLSDKRQIWRGHFWVKFGLILHAYRPTILAYNDGGVAALVYCPGRPVSRLQYCGLWHAVSTTTAVLWSRPVTCFCRAMLCKRCLSRHAVSVCLSVCPSVCHVRGLSKWTSVSETIRKPPLVKDQTALKNKKKYGEKRFSIWGWNSYTLQCACGSENMTVNSPSGSTLQCDTWLWDDMPLNSPKRPPYWNSTSSFDFDQSPQSTFHSAPVCEILSKSDHPNIVDRTGPPSAEKKWRHVNFQDGGSQPSWILGVQ